MTKKTDERLTGVNPAEYGATRGWRERIMSKASEKHWSARRLGLESGIPLASAGNYFHGPETNKTSAEWLPVPAALRIAKALGVTVEWVLLGTEPDKSSLRAVSLPVCSVEHAHMTDAPARGAVIVDRAMGGDVKAAILADKSMLPTYEPGVVVIYREDLQPDPGDLCMVYFESDKRSYLRRYRVSDDGGKAGSVFLPDNTLFPTKTFKDLKGWKLLGSVIQLVVPTRIEGAIHGRTI